MDWRAIVKLLLADISEIGVDAEVELVLGDKSQGVVAIKIRCNTKLEAG